MASPVLHIKDAYYFEVPKVLCSAHYGDKAEFPDVWVKLDPDFQLWEAQRLHDRLTLYANPPAWNELKSEYLSWVGRHGNFGKPLDVMLEEQFEHSWDRYQQLAKSHPTRNKSSFAEYLGQRHDPGAWFSRNMIGSLNKPDVEFAQRWNQIRREAGDVAEYKESSAEWSPKKIDAYNEHLSGKILIPQVAGGELRNLYEPESGFCISKFMVVQFVVALVLLAVFHWLGRKVASGRTPQGRLWNLLEMFLVFLRDNVARSAIGGHHADKFVPLLWTMFMFVLVCNLCGMIPWVGTPTGAFGVTAGLAVVTFAVTLGAGMSQFGVVGFVKNQIPSMDLPLVMAVFIKPLLLVLELIGLTIKHAVLAIRLLANMVAGHLVLLGILGLAFGAMAAASFAHLPTWLWAGTAVVSVVASTLFSCLELFVAFLQAYIFTFLSALFIGAAMHHH